MVSYYETEMRRLSLNRSIREKLYARNPEGFITQFSKMDEDSLVIALHQELVLETEFFPKYD